MTIQEILKAQGVSEEQITNIVASMKVNKIFTTSEENLDIRYGKLKTDFDNLTNQHGEATKLIDEMKKANKGNEELQSKISTYESQIANLQDELQKTQKKADLKVALLEAKALDIDYLVYKLEEAGELEVDESGKIKGLDDKIAGLKTKYPNQFEVAGQKQILENKLNNNNNNENQLTKADILKKPYAERVKLFNENPDVYKEIMNK